MIIDTHCHIFPHKIASKAVENIGKFYDLPMHGNSGELESLLESGRTNGVDGFIVNSSATARHQVEGINTFIADTIKGQKNVWGLCTLHQNLNEQEIDEQIQFAIDNHLIGIKLHPDFQKFYIDDPIMYKIYDRASGVLPILFHTGDSRFEYSAPGRLAKIAKMFPDLKCIGAHFGGYERWNEVDCYRDTPNVYFDTSSTLFKLDKDVAVKMIRSMGVHRFMFGVDFPMWSHYEELKYYFALELTDEENEKILYQNACDFYHINVD